MKIIKERQEVQVSCLNCNSLLELSADDVKYHTSGFVMSNTLQYYPQKEHFEYNCGVCERRIALGEYQIPEEFKEKARRNKEKISKE